MSAEAPLIRIRAVELYERPVKLRLTFRFGLVTLTECPQAVVRAHVELPDGRSAWGVAAEMMAPKWFDKNLALSNEDNFEQLRTVLRIAREAYLGDGTPATAFRHFERHHAACLAEGARRGFNPLLASYGPAQIDRAVLDAVCRALIQDPPRGHSASPAWLSSTKATAPAPPIRANEKRPRGSRAAGRGASSERIRL